MDDLKTSSEVECLLTIVKYFWKERRSHDMMGREKHMLNCLLLSTEARIIVCGAIIERNPPIKGASL